LVEGFREGIVVAQGLIAHGRGECFDYLIGETTIPAAMKAVRAAAAALLLARNPVISVNGNVAALAAKHVVELAKLVGAKIEVNLFHWSLERAKKIANHLLSVGAEKVLGLEDAKPLIPGLEHSRARASPEGIYIADVVLVALEDGDRTEALRRMGKTVIAIDLNPLSRTARTASITIVDNVVRAFPKLVEAVKELKQLPRERLETMLREYDNDRVLREVLEFIVKRLQSLSQNRLVVDLG
jgi:4-phosphopantoate--beta-alanine ligase